jgi:hypothetical protein
MVSYLKIIKNLSKMKIQGPIDFTKVDVFWELEFWDPS